MIGNITWNVLISNISRWCSCFSGHFAFVSEQKSFRLSKKVFSVFKICENRDVFANQRKCPTIFYVLILPEEPQSFKAQFPRNREQIENAKFSLNRCVLNKVAANSLFGEIPFFIFPAKDSLKNPYRDAIGHDFWKIYIVPVVRWNWKYDFLQLNYIFQKIKRMFS